MVNKKKEKFNWFIFLSIISLFTLDFITTNICINFHTCEEINFFPKFIYSFGLFGIMIDFIISIFAIYLFTLILTSVTIDKNKLWRFIPCIVVWSLQIFTIIHTVILW